MGGWIGGGAGRKRYKSELNPPSKVGRRPGSRTVELGKVTKLVHPGHQWLQVGMVLVVSAGAGSNGCVMPAPESEGSLNAQLSIAHAMFSVSSDTMRNHVMVRNMLKNYRKASHQTLILVKFTHAAMDRF